MRTTEIGTSPFARFGKTVASGAATQSRRDLMRAGAVLAAASGLGLAHGVTRVTASAPSRTLLVQDDIETGVELAIPFDPFGQPVILHPHRAPNWGPFWVLLPHAWAGLLAFDEFGSVVPDLAESVVPNDSADVWTATLRPDLVFASGNPITAQSFVASWMRALDPRQPAPMASFMALVEGYDAYIAGESSEIGFRAVDDLTIEITLSQPYSSFPASMATFVWAAVDLSVADDPDAGDPVFAGASAGSWQFSELIDGERIVMVPNELAAEPASPSIARVTWLVAEGPDANARGLADYQSDAVASLDVPASLLATIEADETLAAELVTIESQASTMAIGMDFNQPPFDDLRVRQAVAAAIDREVWAAEIQAGEFVPATGLVPPVVNLTSGYQSAAPIAFDPARAASLLDQAGIDPEATPDIVYYQPATDSADAIEQRAALLAMIASNSGLEIRHDVTLTSEQIVALQGDNGGRQFDIVWWWTVTDTPALLETVGLPESSWMTGWFNWSAELEGINGQTPGTLATEFAELVTGANADLEPDSRNEAFSQAESILLDNAVFIPLGHWVQRYVQKPWLQGTRQGPWSGRIPVRFDADVVVRGREAS